MNYKAWDKKFERMVQTNELCYVTNEGVFMLRPDHKENLYELLPIERFDIIRSTGLTDRNGVDIYEGDIVQRTEMGYTFIQAVEFKEGSFGTGGYFFTPLSTKGKYDDGRSSFEFTREYEVLGNIYEHPHLLEGVK